MAIGGVLTTNQKKKTLDALDDVHFTENEKSTNEQVTSKGNDDKSQSSENVRKKKSWIPHQDNVPVDNDLTIKQ